MKYLDLTQDATTLNLDLSAVASTLSSEERKVTIETWRGRMRNEFVSARVFEQLIPQMAEVGLSLSSQESVAAMMNDELRHGRLCAGVVQALGGTAIVDLGVLPKVPAHDDVDALEGLLRNVLSVSCLSETVAVALISSERLHADNPIIQETLRSILADEVQHARFGWALLKELDGVLTPSLCRRLGDYLASAFLDLQTYQLASIPAGPAPSARGESVGLCDGPSARRIFFSTVHEVIIPGLEAHGLPAGRAWCASVRLAA